MKNLSRIKKFQQTLSDGAYLIEDPTQIFYLTGIKLSLGRLLITKRGYKLFVDGRYIEECKKKLPGHVFPRVEKKLAEKLYFDPAVTTYTNYLLNKKLCKTLKTKKNPVDRMRWVKDADELVAMRKSAKLLWECYQALVKKLKVGVTEIEMARAFEIIALQKGAEGLSFEPIIAFGENTSKPHYHPGNVKLKVNDVVLFDLGVMKEGYASDMTRCHLRGKVSSQIQEMEKVVKQAAKAAIALCKPGVPIGELDKAARAVMHEAKLEKYFLHTLGHGIGLEVHEGFRIHHQGDDAKVLLEPGMVFTIEPGLYVAGVGGIRHEEMIVVGKKGPENLFL
ncbi:MAG: Xaa-Pro peptidase family protein [Candidatus Algichlamydia australiensis]|nr:Xaa-Pro peptidase family protein [Chlamydiales bacterium]